MRLGDRIVRLRFNKLSACVRVATRGKDLILFTQVNSVVDPVSIDHRVAVKVIKELCRAVPTNPWMVPPTNGTVVCDWFGIGA